jgi:hypothetical protein
LAKGKKGGKMTLKILEELDHQSNTAHANPATDVKVPEDNKPMRSPSLA